MIAMGMLYLLSDAALAAHLRAKPADIRLAVEEFLRFTSPVQFSPRRVARCDVEVGGVTIRKGEGLFLSLASANRDETVFAAPDVLDIHRDNAAQIAFGFGIHQCLGQVLARIELQVIFERLLVGMPSLALDVPFDDLRFKHDMQIYGVHNLPVRWLR
jgi:cytochrome P450